MVLHRRDGDPERERDVLVPEPGGEQVRDVALPRGEPIEHREDSDIVGNVIRKTNDGFATRIGGDGTMDTNGRYRFVNNTFIHDMSGAVRVNRNSAPSGCAGGGSQLSRVDVVQNVGVLADTAEVDVVAGDGDTTGWVVDGNVFTEDGAGLCLDSDMAAWPWALMRPGSTMWSGRSSACLGSNAAARS